ncbi:regulatory protein RecX [Microbacterium sp. NPDC058345]|uniref:regulatory protein RecX n=1 Tax=Microbacterium sp. NPDC058345 TaxID=3346455 RepID=UPI00364D53D3
MSSDDGGEGRLAPVIPLFGARRPDLAPSVPDLPPESPSPEDAAADGALRHRTVDETVRRPAEDDRRPAPGPPDAARHHPAFAAAERRAEAAPRLRVLGAHPADRGLSDGSGAEHADDGATRERAQDALVRRLRSRQLSVAEARAVLRENDLDREAIEEVIEEFQDRGYLDDRTLASLLVTSGVERKGQGRVALSRALAQRGVPREVIDEVLAELPDDDAERALEFARAKAPGMSRLEFETALRRLLGQLARRGYGGSVAMNAARTALREAQGSGRGGVRFTESD